MLTYWFDKGGKSHEIRNMSTEHIKNCIALLKRKIDEIENLAFPMLQGEEAQNICEYEFFRAIDSFSVPNAKKYIRAFNKELRRRVIT